MKETKYFQEVGHMWQYLIDNKITNYDYNFTFAYGYALTYEVPETPAK